MNNTKDTAYGWNSSMKIPLSEKLKSDLKTAMLAKDTDRKNTIRLIMAEYPKLTVPITLESGKKTTRLKKPDEITDDDVLDIIRKLVKSEKTVLETKNEVSSEYLNMLEEYLPQMAGREEITAWIEENIDFSAYKNRMQAIGTVMKHFGKLADGSLVKKILQDW